ncbi:cyclin-dependent kinase 11B-like [Nasonia vitripennis]|uniref:Retrotransposon gag domain-containing protein n=1 Tax=Nasonia vitripennis TaxID=7425 RepID=A0A7M7Q614_NASVI|nr:cyclin-dependent kinase 11B-like [Nasonia vitripennis]
MNQLTKRPFVVGLGVEPNAKRDSVGGSTVSPRDVLRRMRSSDSESANGDDWHTVSHKRRRRGSRVKLFDGSRKREDSSISLSSDNESQERSSSLCSSERDSVYTVIPRCERPGYLRLSERTIARTAACATSSTVSDVAEGDVLRGGSGSSIDVSVDSGYASRVSVDRSERDARVRELEECGLTLEDARARVFEEELSVAWREAYEEALLEARAKLRDELATLEHERRLQRVREEAREAAREQVRVEAIEQMRKMEEERIGRKPCLRAPVKTTDSVRPDTLDQLRGRPSVFTSDIGDADKELLEPERETVRRRVSWGNSGGRPSMQRSCVSSGEESEEESGQGEKSAEEESEEESERREKSASRKRRRQRGLLSSDSELEVNSSCEFNSANLTSSERRKRSADSLRALEFLKHWELQFSGESDHEEAEEFFDRLCECRVALAVPDRELLAVLPCIFKLQASRWYRAKRKSLRTWEMFCRAFRRRYMVPYCREDLEEDLRKRTQHREEKIAAYIASLQYLASRFRRPPSERDLLRIAYQNLLPEYRRAIGEKCVNSWEELERYGRRWERLKELDSHYAPPLPAEKMRVPGAAYKEEGETQRAAAVERTEHAGPGDELPSIEAIATDIMPTLQTSEPLRSVSRLPEKNGNARKTES